MLTDDKAGRKALPLATGCLDYFPDALAAVAGLSMVGNQQHNPGEPLHWAKEKSRDEADALMRHLVQRGTVDVDGVRHSAKVAWRALALLQREIDVENGYYYCAARDAWTNEPRPTSISDVLAARVAASRTRPSAAPQVFCHPRPDGGSTPFPPLGGSDACPTCNKVLCWDVYHLPERQALGRDAYRGDR